jgi:hypothetical protein
MFQDTIITAQRKRKEVRIFLSCFIIAFLVNILAIIIYKSHWTQIITSSGYVFIIGICFYILILFLRLIVQLFKGIHKKSS